MPSGIVFDLQRASFHDGPGLRTTVFLKGCPLRCAWCHNPESQSLRPQLGYTAEQCISCQSCVDACASGVHRFDAGGRHGVAWDTCRATGACVRTCPSGALQLFGSRQEVDEILAIVLRDRAYYESSGGGLTLSGGEPTVQIDFAEALLREARARGLHTCVETCGFGRREDYARLLGCTDLFLFDFKASDEARHLAYTGAPLAPVLANLRWLAAQGARILLRCPIVPGCNDDLDHFRAIARLRSELPLEGVELLPYHDSGVAKYGRIGRAFPSIRPPIPTPEQFASWQVLVEADCRDSLNPVSPPSPPRPSA